MASSVVKSASLVNGSVTENKTVLMGQMKKNVSKKKMKDEEQ
jgi:hypothetical protein